MGEQADEHGDTTEESSDAGGDDGPTTADIGPSAAAGFDTSDYEDSEDERGLPPPPAPAARGKFPLRDVADQVDDGIREVVDLSSDSDLDSEGSSSVPTAKPLQSARRTKKLEAAARKVQTAPSQQVLKERRSKAAAESGTVKVPARRGGSFVSRNMLPAKKLSTASSRPTTACLAPSGKPSAEQKVDAIMAATRARLAREAREKDE